MNERCLAPRDRPDGDRRCAMRCAGRPGKPPPPVKLSRDAKDELECGAAKDDLLQGGGALEPGEGDQSDVKDELVCHAAKDDFWQDGGALDPGEGDCEIGAKVEVEKIDVYKVRAEEFANLEVLRAGQLDPGEVRGSWQEVP